MDPHWFETMQTQHALAAMSDRPGQFRESQFSALFQQCWREKYGQGDDGPSYLSMPF